MADLKHPFALPAGYALNSTQKGELRVHVVKLEFAAGEEPTEGDTLWLCKLPALHVPVDCTLWADDLDSNGTPAIILDVGIKDEKQDPSDTTDVDALIDASDVAQAGGRVNMNVITGVEIAPLPYDRIVTLTWSTDAATFQAGGLIFQLLMRNKMDDAYEVGLLPS